MQCLYVRHMSRYWNGRLRLVVSLEIPLISMDSVIVGFHHPAAV